jgi:hypothetical protein
MRRRDFIAGLGGAAAWPFVRPLAEEAQRRVGALISGTEYSQRIFGAFRGDWRHSAGSKAVTCGSIIASPAAISPVSLRMRRNS